ncbi:MAG TPA: hypothetical protein EYH56_01135 [Nanoarchaeota archaeon]|nr:hypothetical protein [Nanoarchaeota archaeon]
MKENKKIKTVTTGIWLLFLLFFTPSLSIEAYLWNGSSTVSSLTYTPGTAPGEDAYYQDAMGENPDVGLMLCGVESPYYVGVVYYMKNSSHSEWVLVSYEKDNTNLPLADESLNYNGKSCKRTDIGKFFISPSYYEDRTPRVYIAAFPARLYALYSSSPTGDNPKFVYLNAKFSGSYSCSLSYTYSSNTISINSLSISATGVGNIGLKDEYRGISEERPLLIGVCRDDSGLECEAGISRLTSPPNFPISYSFDIPQAQVNDQHTYKRYGVVNGLKCGEICIGADLTISSLSVKKNPIYYSQTQEIYITIKNSGNVPVTTDFKVKIEIKNSTGYVVYSKEINIEEEISENGNTKYLKVTWEAYARSGEYTVYVTVDSEKNITECNEGNNQKSKTFELKPITLPEIWINGKQTNTFPYPGVPYNFSLYLKNSDNETLRNARVKLVEVNGLSLFTPTQIWEKVYDEHGNKIKNATKVTTITEVYTDYYGWVNLTLIPTGNKLFAPEYNYTNASEILGNYSLYITGEYRKNGKWEAFKFVVNNELSDTYPLYIQNPYTYKAYEQESKFHNQESFVKVVMDWIYTIFANFWKAIVK